MDSDGFTVVRGTGRRSKISQARSRDSPRFRYTHTKPHAGDNPGELHADDLHRRIAAAAAGLEASQYWAQCTELLAGVLRGDAADGMGWRWHRTNEAGGADGARREAGAGALRGDGFVVRDVVCYGIGSLVESRNARDQLAFAVVLAEWLQIGGAVYVYDPVLTADEVDAAGRLGCAPIPHNEDGKRRARVGTLFYMPRCGALLYNNVLWANWRGAGLGHVAVLGNSFEAYGLRHPARRLEAAVPYLHKILPHVHERALPDQPPESPFSATTLVTFPNTQSMAPDFWDDTPEPPPLVDGIEI